MTAFEAYHKYNALKLHFISEAYDFFRYNGQIKTTLSGFERRKDKFWYDKLAKKPDLVNYIVANLIDGDRAKWVGGLLQDTECAKIYTKWLARQQSITYFFENQLAVLEPRFDDNLKVDVGQHPLVLKYLLGNKLSYETVIILDDLCNFFPVWDKKLKDDILWPTVRLRCIKYKPFIRYNKAKMREAVLRKFEN